MVTIAAPAGADLTRLPDVQHALVAWYRQHGRDLPWRHSRDPYAVLVSELMLQQTQVERVLPRWRAWLEQFPTLAALAAAPRADVIRAWQGLGYNLRAVRLHELARWAVDQNGGQLPRTLEGLLALKGLGRYTAGAVACFALALPVSMVDTNVRRVLGRVFLGQPDYQGHARAAQALADTALPPDDAFDWNQALMDLGATICTAARPACLVCPLREHCRAAPLMGGWVAERGRLLRERRASYDVANEKASSRRRQLRGRIVDAVRGAPPQGLPFAELAIAVAADPGELETLVARLVSDGLLHVAGGDGPAAAWRLHFGD